MRTPTDAVQFVFEKGFEKTKGRSEMRWGVIICDGDLLISVNNFTNDITLCILYTYHFIHK